MFDITFLQSTDHFTTKTLTKNEVLFDEGNEDENLYIIIDGELSIEKYTTNENKETKQLAVLKKGNFLGEGGLNGDFVKQVKVESLSTTKLLVINGQKGFSDFTKAYPEQAKNVLTYIISLTNKRLTDSNTYITSVYQINKTIRELKTVNFKEIFKILDTINTIMESELLLFLEVNPVMKEYLTLKYDSRECGKMLDIIVEKGNYSLDEIGIHGDYKILTKEITLGEESLGNIIVGKTQDFTENEKRIFLALISSLSGVLKQKKISEEERDREFSQN